jgi:hypothetical protein
VRLSGGGTVVVGQRRVMGRRRGIFHQGAHLHTHMALTHIHDKGGGESFPRVVHILPVEFFFFVFFFQN